MNLNIFADLSPNNMRKLDEFRYPGIFVSRCGGIQVQNVFNGKDEFPRTWVLPLTSTFVYGLYNSDLDPSEAKIENRREYRFYSSLFLLNKRIGFYREDY